MLTLVWSDVSLVLPGQHPFFSGMDHIQSIFLFLAISLVVDILVSFKVDEPEGEHATGTYGMAIGILRRPDLPAELREMMLEGLNLFEYAEYLS